MPISDYLAEKVLDHLLGAVVFTTPATVYIALMTSAPTTAGGGTEVTGGAYARVAVTNNATNFPATGTDREKTNGTTLTFAQASAAWGSVVAVAVYDALTAGNLLFYGLFTTPRTVAINDQPSYAVGQLKFKALT